MDERFKQIRNILIYILALNWLVAILKIAVGYMFGVVSMVADGFHSFSDGASNIIGLVGITLASRPKDEDHPYGHKKIETFTSLAIAMLLLVVAYEVLREALARVFDPGTPDASPATFIVMGVTLAVNIWVVYHEYRKGKELKSDVLIADSYHTRADVFVSLLVVASLISIRLGMPVIDILASFVIIAFILYSAFKVIRNVYDVLVDRAVIDCRKIEGVVLGFPGIKRCHKVRTHGREDDIQMDLHITVDPRMKVEESHKLSHQLAEKIKNTFPGVTDVMIHVEPLKK